MKELENTFLYMETKTNMCAYVVLFRMGKHDCLHFMHKTSVQQHLPVELDPTD